MTTTATTTSAATTAPVASDTSSTRTTGRAEVGPSSAAVHHREQSDFPLRGGEAQRQDRQAVGTVKNETRSQG